MKKQASVLLLIATITISLSLIGCNANPKKITQPLETTIFATTSTEYNITPPTQAETDTSLELASEYTPDKICLQLRPTGMVTQGEEFLYYTPSDQDVWLSAWEAAKQKAVSDQYWRDEDRSAGVWVRYQDEWWRLLKNGDILTLSHERINAENCQELNALVKEAMAQLGMEPSVQPEQIQNICKATLEWNGSHTLTDPNKLRRMEALLSGSEELAAGANCWFTALLTLELENGEQLTLSMATDDCGTWLSQGVFYEYSQSGNEEFFSLFESQSAVEPTQPESHPVPDVQELDDDELVRIADYLPQAIQNLRYATDGNFTGERIYDFSEAYLRYGTVKNSKRSARIWLLKGIGC